MKNVAKRFAQISIGNDPNAYANFDLELGVLGTKANVESSIIPAGDGWYRCTMTITSNLGIAFLLNLFDDRRERYPGAREFNVGCDIRLFSTDGTRPNSYKLHPNKRY